MELLELIRRWMWMFLRVEKEWCARGEAQMNIPYMLDEEEGRGEEVEGFRLEEWRKHGGEDGGMGEKV